MFEPTWSDEVADQRAQEAFADGFEREVEDRDTVEDEIDDWMRGPVYHPRVSEVTDLEAGRQRFMILCDDGQEIELKTQIAKLNKKLAKWGQVITVVAEEEVLTEHWFNRHLHRQVPQESFNSEKDANLRGFAKRTTRQVQLTIESPVVAGTKAKLIGAFELAEDGKSVYRHALNGATEADIEPFLARWNDCDHCGFKRDRHASFVCETTDGERVVIGRQCSRDYLGLDAAELLAREAVRKVLANGGLDPDEMVGGGGWGAQFIHVESLVEKAYIVAKRLGGYSREAGDTFREHVAALQGAKDYPPSKRNANLRAEYKAWLEKAKPEPLDFNAFADYIFGADGDFGENLRIAFSLEWAKPKRRNLIIAGVGLFVGRLLRQKQDAEKQAAKPPAKHLDGVQGARVDFNGVVERCVPLESDFGPKTLVAILADDGSRCVHFCTAAVVPEAGKRYGIRATIKDHGTDRRFGTPQTTITRAVYGEPSATQPKLI